MRIARIKGPLAFIFWWTKKIMLWAKSFLICSNSNFLPLKEQILEEGVGRFSVAQGRNPCFPTPLSYYIIIVKNILSITTHISQDFLKNLIF